MHCRARILEARRRRSIQAVALLAWLGFLAVLAILAAFLLPVLIREIDFRAARDESATLKALGDALRSAVQRHGYIPAETNWAETAATEAGLATISVVTNPRRQPRLLLIDTNGWFNNVSLPYTQTSAGTANRPLNARMIIASSLGKALPLTAGRLSASEFSALWLAAEGTTNFPATGVWAGWNGRTDDVKLERVHFSPLFIRLLVETYAKGDLSTNQPGQYSIGANGPLPAPYHSDSNAVTTAYYLQKTALRLYSAATNLDSTQVLFRNSAFLYQNGTWRSSVEGGALPGGVDIAGMTHAFLNATPNTQARNGAAQQKLAALAMMNYMSNYVVWADGNFADNGLKTYLLNNVQPNMIGTLQDLFQGTYYPTNASGPQ